MKVYSWNINGIRAVWNKGLFQEFIAKHSPDILCLQETKAEQDQSPVDLPEYQEFWNSSKTRKGYSGTAIFSKLKPLNILYDLPESIVAKFGLVADGYGDPNAEGRIIAAEYEEYFVVTAYTPNSKDDLSRIPLRQMWDPAVLAYCQLLEKSKPVIYCGDMNVAHAEDDLANPKQNVGKKGFTQEERSGFQNYIDNGYLDSFRQFVSGNGHYTWWTHWANARARNVGWRIDYFLVSGALKARLKSAAIHADVMGSDHCPVSIEVA